MAHHVTNYVTGRKQNGIPAPDRDSEAARLWREFDKLTPIEDGVKRVPTIDEVSRKVTANVSNRAIEYNRWKKFNGFV